MTSAPSKITLLFIGVYSLFMLWWSLCENAPKVRAAKSVVVFASTNSEKFEPVTSDGKLRVAKLDAAQRVPTLPTGRVVAQASAQHIQPGEVGGFASYRWPGSPPAYPGEAVTAYVRVPSTKSAQALTVNQAGEFPRMMTQPGETVQVRLAFTQSEPGSPVALSSEDGGLIESTWRTSAGKLDAARQLAFAYTVSKNPGIHRISIRTPSGESKILEFWAGQPLALKKP